MLWSCCFLPEHPVTADTLSRKHWRLGKEGSVVWGSNGTNHMCSMTSDNVFVRPPGFAIQLKKNLITETFFILIMRPGFDPWTIPQQTVVSC